jgi:hypothetical protein
MPPLAWNTYRKAIWGQIDNPLNNSSWELAIMRTDPKHLDSQHCKDTPSHCIPKSPKANCILNSKAKAAAFKVPDIIMHLQVMEQQRKTGKIKTDFSSVQKLKCQYNKCTSYLFPDDILCIKDYKF